MAFACRRRVSAQGLAEESVQFSCPNDPLCTLAHFSNGTEYPVKFLFFPCGHADEGCLVKKKEFVTYGFLGLFHARFPGGIRVIEIPFVGDYNTGFLLALD